MEQFLHTAFIHIWKFFKAFQNVERKKADVAFLTGFCIQTTDGTGSKISGIAVRLAIAAKQGILQTFKNAFLDKSFSGDDQPLFIRYGQRDIVEGRNIMGNDLPFFSIAPGGTFCQFAVFIYQFDGKTI